MPYLSYFLVWVVAIGALVYNFVIKKGRNRREAQAGEDKKRVRQAVERVLNGAGDFHLAYAHWEEHEHYARSVKTTYYRYAAAFQGQTLWVMPLGIDKKTREVQAGQPMMLNAERLGRIIVKKKEKDGAVSQLDVWLGNKQGQTLAQLVVDAENLRKSRWFPVNILQQEECEAFERFITPLVRQVSKENPEVEAKMEADAKEGFGVIGVILAGMGVIGGLGFPPVGAALCLAGLALAIAGVIKGAKGKVCLMITAVCFAIMAAVSWPYLMALLS